MNTYGIVSVFDEGELEARKHTDQIDLEGMRVLAFNLIDDSLLNLMIQDEEENITSIIVDTDKFVIAIEGLLTEIKELRG